MAAKPNFSVPRWAPPALQRLRRSRSLAGDYDPGARIQEVIWLDDLPVGLIAKDPAANDRLYYIQPDHLGSPRVVIDPI
ncbi:hypothetical protein ACFOED_06415 [Vulcaniibacterium thermophilum]|uniref:Uncharacterized protein n=1 Tax=Vulcaniibacterium thermophilum TaxID=1169913 RepID=A0A918YTT5_9GAMM|nr:hypothetical protein [Vulcaniibacterium thermophilum]GHE24620.1 hypothetical protein GCM10007167_00030 [Vulcaniibacterium thermophilum]